MGKNNRRRRAEKARTRARAHNGRGEDRRHQPGWQEWEPSPLSEGERAAIALEGAVLARCRGDKEGEAQLARALAAGNQRIVRREAEAMLRRALPNLWDHGWQPAELVRHARRTSVRGGRIVAAGVLADHLVRAPSTLHPRWAAQVDDVATACSPGPPPPSNGWLTRVLDAEGLGTDGSIEAVLDALVACLGVGPLTVLLPPPGTAGHPADAPAATGTDEETLGRVRALLAQAESTTFEAEAAAFTAKAQELMTRHAIDHALLWEEAGRDEVPVTTRIPIDDPYADAKSLLLQVVADHSRCRSVFHARYSMSSVIGFAADVATAELLFTSLLVQSQIALQVEAGAARAGSRARSRSFRSAFLLAYASRIDQRLAEVNDSVTDAAAVTDPSALLPVLAARLDAVDEAVGAQFGEVVAMKVRAGDDALGWARGRFAADRAQLTFGDLEPDGGRADTPSAYHGSRRAIELALQ